MQYIENQFIDITLTEKDYTANENQLTRYTRVWDGYGSFRGKTAVSDLFSSLINRYGICCRNDIVKYNISIFFPYQAFYGYMGFLRSRPLFL